MLLNLEDDNKSCFACGENNHIGLKLHFQPRPEGGARANFVLPDFCQGWHGIAHGGIVATVLDEVMAYAVLYSQAYGVTAAMNIIYRAPVPLGQELCAESWLEDRRRRLATARGRILQDGRVLAEAEGKFMLKLNSSSPPFP